MNRSSIYLLILGLIVRPPHRVASAEFSKSATLLHGPLRAFKANPRYFTDETGKPIYLAGIEYEDALREDGERVPAAVSYADFLDTVTKYDLNLIRLWRWSELFRFRYEEGEPFVTSFMPWKRTGPGLALDGRPKFDLSKFDDTYFERLRERVSAAGEKGIYVSVMLFEGHALSFSKPPWRWDGHPFNKNNNINDVNADANGDGVGLEAHTLQSPKVTAFQEAYVRKVIDTLNDFDNVLYEITNETGSHSTEWQYHIIRFIHDYERNRPKQHPVGMSFQYPGGTDRALFESPADWIAPGDEYRKNPPAALGNKVIVSDTDHFGGRPGSREWVWQSFLRGLNTLNYGLMGLGNSADKSPELVEAARAMGQTRRIAGRINLAEMTPRNELSTTSYCLAKPGAAYLVYQPKNRQPFTVTLERGPYRYEWIHPVTGASSNESFIEALDASTHFTSPIDGDALLYLQRK